MMDLIHWFFNGKSPDVAESAIAAPVATLEKTEPLKKRPVIFDIVKEGNPDVFLRDLQSLKPLTQQFERAREELLQELQRLAPPRRRSTRKDAA